MSTTSSLSNRPLTSAVSGSASSHRPAAGLPTIGIHGDPFDRLVLMISLVVVPPPSTAAPPAYDVAWLKAVLAWAMGAGLLDRNPLLGYVPPAEASPRRPIVTASEYEALLATSDPIHPFFRLALIVVHETGHRRLQGLTRGFFLDLRAVRIKAGANGVTVNRDLVAVSAFLRWCEEVKDLTGPRVALPREKENPGRDRWLSADELAQLYLELPAEWVPLFQLLASTGLRISEALGLTWQDVRFAERTLRVRGQGVETTKGHRRVVPMGQALARTLAKHRETLLAGAHDPVFPRPFSAQAAVRLLARVAKRLRWPHTVVHDLRRTFAVHALASGIPLARVQRWLGHRTPAMTLRYAQHAPEPHADDDAARVEASMVGVANREAEALQELLKVVEA